jgi:hypothetical protein
MTHSVIERSLRHHRAIIRRGYARAMNAIVSFPSVSVAPLSVPPASGVLPMGSGAAVAVTLLLALLTCLAALWAAQARRAHRPHRRRAATMEGAPPARRIRYGAA